MPYFGSWHSTAKHWLIWLLSGNWQNLGNTYGSVLVASGSYSCTLTASDCAEGYQFKPSVCACVSSSPILFDTAGDGYGLTNAADGVVFDIDANGVTAEQIAWTEADSDDGWLVLDRDGNGRIDSGEELFGSQTPAYADSEQPVTENGFDALKLLEGPSYGPGKPDRLIDARDAVFARLRLWFDRNHNGVSELEELVTLADAGVLAISTDYKENARRDQVRKQVFAHGEGAVPRTPWPGDLAEHLRRLSHRHRTRKTVTREHATAFARAAILTRVGSPRIERSTRNRVDRTTRGPDLRATALCRPGSPTASRREPDHSHSRLGLRPKLQADIAVRADTRRDPASPVSGNGGSCRWCRDVNGAPPRFERGDELGTGACISRVMKRAPSMKTCRMENVAHRLLTSCILHTGGVCQPLVSP